MSPGVMTEIVLERIIVNQELKHSRTWVEEKSMARCEGPEINFKGTVSLIGQTYNQINVMQAVESQKNQSRVVSISLGVKKGFRVQVILELVWEIDWVCSHMNRVKKDISHQRNFTCRTAKA